MSRVASVAHLFGVLPDRVLAARVGISRQAVSKARAAAGVERCPSSTLDWSQHVEALRTEGADALAARLGVNPATIWKARRRLGIDDPPPEQSWLRMAQNAAVARGEKPPSTLDEARRQSKQRRHRAHARRESERAAARRLDERGTVGLVYFVRCGELVKIGWTGGALSERLKAMDTHCPPYTVLGVILEQTPLDEKQLHRRFDALRIKDRRSREWFKLDLELLAHIKAHAKVTGYQ